MRLVRLDSSSFSQLEKAWRGQCEAFNEDFASYAQQSVEHAKRISAENPPALKYGIYCLQNEGNFEAIMHINIADLPGTDGKTLRAVWILPAPEYDYGDMPTDKISMLCNGIMSQLVNLSDSECKAKHIKIHIGNMVDRELFHRMSELMRGLSYFTDARVRGNWFHLSKA